MRLFSGLAVIGLRLIRLETMDGACVRAEPGGSGAFIGGTLASPTLRGRPGDVELGVFAVAAGSL